MGDEDDEGARRKTLTDDACRMMENADVVLHARHLLATSRTMVGGRVEMANAESKKGSVIVVAAVVTDVLYFRSMSHIRFCNLSSSMSSPLLSFFEKSR